MSDYHLISLQNLFLILLPLLLEEEPVRYRDSNLDKPSILLRINGDTI